VGILGSRVTIGCPGLYEKASTMAKKRKRRKRKRQPEVTVEAPPEPESVPLSEEEPAVEQRGDAPGARSRPTSDRWIVLGLVALLGLNMLIAAHRNSGTCDELGAHIPAGFLYWSSGQYSGGIDNFPLGQLLIALPVRLLGLDYQLFSEQHLLLFRLPVLLLGLGLAIVVWRLAGRLHGRLPALAALLLVSLSPNLIAHSTLATLDVPTTFAVLLSLFLLHRYFETPSPGRLIAFAAALAVALAVKIQAVLLLPITAIVLAVLAIDRESGDAGQRLRRAASWLLIPLVAVVLIDLVYLHLPVVEGGLLPEPYLEAFLGKLSHGGQGHFAYLMGDYSSDGWWYYFPVAILVKTPLPVLLLVAVGLARRPSRATVLFVLLPIAVFLAAGIQGRVNIGLRHVLPIYPLLYLLAGVGAAALWRAGRLRPAVGGLLLWLAAEALWIHPHHLSYFNQLAGGATGGHRFLIDSNYDWGQNDRFLRRRVEESGLDYQINPDPFRATGGPVLVNANARYGLLNGGPAAYRWLEDATPVNRIAYTWFEYDLPARTDAPPADEPDPAQAYLLLLRERVRGITDPTFRVPLARALAAARLYDAALDELRAVLEAAPEHEPALAVGGELIVKHKLGVLRYRDQEYLQGFSTPSAPESIRLPEVVAQVRGSELGSSMSTAHTALGFVLFGQRELRGAIESFGLASELDPSNQIARDNLEQLLRLAPAQADR
jgi:tetratricopeptide (TPR) repeat protein